MEIVKHNGKICPSLQKDEIIFIEARNSPNILSVNHKDLKMFLLKLIGKTHLATGQQPNEQAIELTIDDLIDYTLKFYPSLSIKDIELSFKMGVGGEFGEFFGLNNKTYFSWFKGLLINSTRVMANRKQSQYLSDLNKPQALTDEEKNAKMIEACKYGFSEVANGRYFNDLGNSVYNFIDRLYKVPFSAQRKKKFLEEAKNIIISQKMNSINTEIVGFKTKKIKEEIEQIKNGNEDEAIILAKKNIINTYFKELIEVGETIESTLIKK